MESKNSIYVYFDSILRKYVIFICLVFMLCIDSLRVQIFVVIKIYRKLKGIYIYEITKYINQIPE